MSQSNASNLCDKHDVMTFFWQSYRFLICTFLFAGKSRK